MAATSQQPTPYRRPYRQQLHSLPFRLLRSRCRRRRRRRRRLPLPRSALHAAAVLPRGERRGVAGKLVLEGCIEPLQILVGCVECGVNRHSVSAVSDPAHVLLADGLLEILYHIVERLYKVGWQIVFDKTRCQRCRLDYPLRYHTWLNSRLAVLGTIFLLLPLMAV